jgi:hypothetical protein
MDATSENETKKVEPGQGALTGFHPLPLVKESPPEWSINKVPDTLTLPRKMIPREGLNPVLTRFASGPKYARWKEPNAALLGLDCQIQATPAGFDTCPEPAEGIRREQLG